MRLGVGDPQVPLRRKTCTVPEIADEMRLVKIAASQSQICCIGRGVEHQAPYGLLKSNKAFDFTRGLTGENFPPPLKLTTPKA